MKIKVKRRRGGLLNLFFRPLSRNNILALYIALKPLYLFPAGTPQISDMLLIAYAAHVFLHLRGGLQFPKRGAKVILAMIGLLLYQLIVNVTWSAVLHDDLYTVTIFYVFNFIAFLLCLILANYLSLENLKSAIIDGCLLSCLVALAGLYVRGGTARSTSFFNNPNQLGYHAVILTSLLFLCIKQAKPWKAVAIAVGSGWLSIASASKAAFLGVLGLLGAYLFFGQKSKGIKVKIIQLIAILLAFSLAYSVLFSDNPIFSGNQRIAFLRYRLSGMDNEDDSDLASGRGYNRIFEMGIHFLWGMGEGAYYRFKTMYGAEAHSTYASIIVSYGLIGSILFLYIFYNILRGKTRLITIKNVMVMSGVALYGISHNGIRNTLLWIFFALMMLCNADDYNEQLNGKAVTI